MSLSDAVAGGSRRVALEALRDGLAWSFEVAEPDKRAPLAARLVEVLDKLAALDAEDGSMKKGSPLDELAKRRADGGSKSPRARRASGEGKRG